MKRTFFLTGSSMKTKFLYVSCLLVFCLVGCSPDAELPTSLPMESTGIIGGDLVQQSELSAKYSMMIYDEETQMMCTGVLVHPKVVLTAAHCLSREPGTMSLAFGVNPLSGKYMKRKAARFYENTDYKKKDYSNRNDIALVLMTENAPLNYMPVLLPDQNFPLRQGFHFTALGYGRFSERSTAHDLQAGSGRLRQTILRIEEFYSDNKQFRVDQTQGKGVCSGDSGGPALVRYRGKNYVVGVASAIWWEETETPPLNKCSQKSIYMNVKAYKGWIDDGLGDLLKK